MAWVAVSAAAIGTAGNLYAANEAKKAAGNAPPPNPLQGPSAVGGVQSQYGGSYRDPVTGQIIQEGWNFDPSNMQAQWDAQSMYNQFIGNAAGGDTTAMDWQIKKLQQDIQRMSQTGKTAPAQIPAEFRALQKYLGEDGKLPNLNDTAALFRSNKPNERALVDEFYAQGGNYGGTGELGFSKWVRDAYSKSLKPQFEAFQKTQDIQGGNSEVNARALQDAQNQLEFLTQQKTKMTDPKAQASLGNNPLMKYTNDTGPAWGENGYRPAWEEVMQRKMAADKDTPTDIYNEYGIGTNADGTDPQAAFRSKMEGLLGGLGDYERAQTGLTAPTLDNGASGNMLGALNFRTNQGFAANRANRDAQLARRGMASSAVNELAGAQDSLLLSNGLNENALSAANYFNTNVANQFGMQAAAQNANNAGIGQNNAADLARRGLGLQYTNSMNSDMFNQDMAKAQFAQNAKNNIFGQAMSALNANNAMKTQDYANARGENQTGYDRTMNMYNLLNQQRQQAFGNNMATAQNAQQASGNLMGQNMQYANWQNQSNAANTQMQNSWQMANAQSNAAANGAMWGAIGSGVGNIANAAGTAWANQNRGTQGGYGSTYANPNGSTTGNMGTDGAWMSTNPYRSN